MMEPNPIVIWHNSYVIIFKTKENKNDCLLDVEDKGEQTERFYIKHTPYEN